MSYYKFYNNANAQIAILSRISLFFFCYLLSFFSIHKSEAQNPDKEILVVSDYSCPYVCEDTKNHKRPGYFVELMQKAFELHGIKVNYKLMPWHEALEAVENEEAEAILAITNANLGNLYKSNAVVNAMIICISDVNDNWGFYDYNSLGSKRIAIEQDRILDQKFDEFIKTYYIKEQHRFVIKSGKAAMIEAINSMINKETDVYIGYDAVIQRHIKHLSFTTKIKSSVVSGKVPLYIAFGNRNQMGLEYTKMLNNGIKSLEAIGDLEILRKKYGVGM